MKVLGIETSCDETGVGLYDSAAGLLGHSVYSQVALHAEFGGVVPEGDADGNWPWTAQALGGHSPSVLRGEVDEAIAYARGSNVLGHAYDEAIAVFRRGLEQFPGSRFYLWGLAQS